MFKRILLVVTSAACFAAATALVTRDLAREGSRVVASRLNALDASARGIEASLASFGHDLPARAARLAAGTGLGAELRQYAAARAFSAGRNLPPAGRARLDGLAAKLEQRLRDFRAPGSRTESIALVSAAGEVVLSDSARFPAGARIKPPAREGDGRGGAEAGGTPVQPERAAPASAAGDAGPAAAPGAEAVLAPAFSGGGGWKVLLQAGTVTAAAAAPVFFRAKLAGIVVVERRLAELPSTTAGEVFAVAGGEVLFGSLPAGLSPPASSPQRLFALAAREDVRLPLFATAFTNDAPAGAAGTAGGLRPGWWAAGFRLPGLEGAQGFVVADVSTSFGETAKAQLFALALAVVLWLAHATVLLTLGLRLQSGVGHLSDVLGAPGGPVAAVALDERSYPAGLRPLVRAVSTALGRAAGAAAPALEAPAALLAAPASPSGPPPPASAEASPVDLDAAPLALERPAPGAPAAIDPAPLALERPAPDAPAAIDPAPLALERPAPDAPAAIDPAPLALDGAAVVLLPAELTPPVPVEPAWPATAKAHAAGARPEPRSAAGVPVAHGDPGGPRLELATDDDGAGVPGRTSTPGAAGAEAAGPAVAPAPLADLLAEGGSAAAGAGTGSALDLVAAHPAASGRERRPAAPLPAAVKHGPPRAAFAEAPPEPRPRPATPAAPAVNSLAAEAVLTPIDDPDALGRRVRQVYEEFVQTRRTCGESSDVPFDKFRVRLEESRQAVMTRHGCSDVRFEVYVKNGRAAVKATPAG